MIDHTRTEKIGGDSIYFCDLPSRAENRYDNNLGKFDAKIDAGIFLDYFLTSKAFRIFNKRTLVVEKSIHVVFDKSNLPSRKDSLNDVGIL